MIARDLMTKDPLTLTEQATLEDAAELMRERDIRHVPIVDRAGALVGIVSDRDLGSLDLGRLIGDAGVEGVRAHLATPVVKVMTPEVITVGPEDGLDEVVDLMLESRVGAVPVVEEHSRRVVGIVSYVDVLRAFRNAQG
jgi:acetoin utilization protein AcuB